MDKYKEIHFDVDWGNAFPLDYLVKQSFFALSIIIPNNAILNYFIIIFIKIFILMC